MPDYMLVNDVPISLSHKHLGWYWLRDDDDGWQGPHDCALAAFVDALNCCILSAREHLTLQVIS